MGLKERTFVNSEVEHWKLWWQKKKSKTVSEKADTVAVGGGAVAVSVCVKITRWKGHAAQSPLVPN